MQWLMAGLLTYSLFAGLPVNCTVASQGQKVWYGAYSSGNCPGFTPGSLSLKKLITKNTLQM